VLSDIPLAIAHLPLPFRLAVLGDYQFKHRSGGRTLSPVPAQACCIGRFGLQVLTS
jgi:hypothetical protein